MVKVRVYTRANAAWVTAAGHVVGGHPNFATIFGGRLPAMAQSERAEFGVGRRGLALCVGRWVEKGGSLPDVGGEGPKTGVGTHSKFGKKPKAFLGGVRDPRSYGVFGRPRRCGCSNDWNFGCDFFRPC
jgi:hypothetical protein